MSISNRAQFIRHQFVQEHIARTRSRHPYRPHSLGVLICDPSLEHLVVGIPFEVKYREPTATLIPPQRRLEVGEHVLPAATAIITQLTSLNSRISEEDVSYLGTTFGNHAGRLRHAKEIHWCGTMLPARERVRGFHSLLQRTDGFVDVRWLSFKEWQAFGNGQATSDAKYRMVLQALVSLGQLRGRSSRSLRFAHGTLSEKDLLPQLQHAVAAQ